MNLTLRAAALPERSALPAVADADFDRLAGLARRLTGSAFATVTLVTRDCQVFPGAAGLPADLDAARTNPLSYSLCQFVVGGREALAVSDTADDPEFATNRSVSELGIRAFAGSPVRDESGEVIGSLSVADFVPREWSADQLDTLDDLAAACSSLLQLRQSAIRRAVTAERDRIAAELHARIIRDLFGHSMHLGNLRSQLSGAAAVELTGAITRIDELIGSLRTVVYAAA